METIRFVAKWHFEMLREYAATHCDYDVPPAQIGWPAMIYVGETDRQAREEFERHFWYWPRRASACRPSHVKRKFISLLSSWQEAEEGTYAIVGSMPHEPDDVQHGAIRAGREARAAGRVPVRRPRRRLSPAPCSSGPHCCWSRPARGFRRTR
jgi:hypothetical protein